MMRTLFALALLLAALPPARAADYVVLVQDQPAGHLKVQTTADGRTEADFAAIAAKSMVRG